MSTHTAPSLLDEFDPFAPEHLAEPYPTLARIQESSPALYVARHDFYLVTRYEDVVMASKRHDVFSSTGGVGIEWKSRPMMPMYDPPKHTQLRRLVAPFFTPRAVQAYTGVIEAAAERAIDRVLERGTGDLIHEVAEPISIGTLAAILGIPPDRQQDLRRWADNTMADLAGGVSMADAARLEDSRREFVAYLRATVQERRQSTREDLISVLLRANDQGGLTEKEVIAFCVLLLVAGFEPSASAVGNVARALALHHPTLEELPDSSQGLAAAIDELLRWDSPVQAFFRNTLSEARVGDVVIPEGKKVMLHFAAANRDPKVFANPTQLNLARSPNPHVAFGVGVHTCLGGPLARLQLLTFLRTLVRKVRALEIVEPEERQDNLLFRRLSRLVLRLQPR